METGDRLFLSILRGPNPHWTRPVFATEDPAIIRAVARALARQLGQEVVPDGEAEWPEPALRGAKTP
jgi:hypothetical protein